MSTPIHAAEHAIAEKLREGLTVYPDHYAEINSAEEFVFPDNYKS